MNVVDVLNSIGTAVHQPEGTTIFKEGDEAAGVYVIRSGAVRLTLQNGHSEVQMRVALAGSVLGLPSTLSNRHYSLTASAIQACELCFIQAEKVIELVRRDAGLGLQLLHIVSDEVRDARAAVAATARRCVDSH